ncbi:rhomboid family intramembrane serine protease [Ralstonia insidiosa]|uniref:rhomboid family intramembrane serine protease n=1 Tax=Ralstonia insidiosa TaxID=190721 RepID=UPI000CEE6015|nr:rhomboid family intramembrane serine protease [Ralstonia insidiosa]
MDQVKSRGIATPDPRQEAFFPSKRNPLKTTRISIWIGFGCAFAISLLALSGRTKAQLIAAGVILPLLLALDWFLRRQQGGGQPLITLTRSDITSGLFPGKQKRYLWRDIESVIVQTVQGTSYLLFRLNSSTGAAQKRGFRFGRDPSKRRLVLSSFDAADRERLLDSIHIHLQLQKGGAIDRSTPVNQFAVERKFEEKLKALAPKPRITYLLIALNMLVWLVTLVLGGSVLQTPLDTLFNLGGNAAYEVQHGEWWRLLSAIFLHAGVVHLVINMIGLYSVGVAVERIYGPVAYVLIYLGAGLLGSALSLSFSAQHAIGVGASGAVFGVAGAWLVAVSRYRNEMPEALSKRLLTQLGSFILYSLVQGLITAGIDNAAHIGGLVGGCALAYILPARLNMERYREVLRSRCTIALAAAVAGISLLAFLAPIATLDHRQFFANSTAVVHGLSSFGNAVQALQADEHAFAAGKLSARQLIERNQTVHMPAIRRAAQALHAANLPQNDPRAALVRNATLCADLMIEGMNLTVMAVPESAGITSPDPQRLASIKTQLVEIGKQMRRDSEALQRRARN